MYQFFVTEEQIGREFITITGGDVKHIKNVLRMRPGETIRVSNQKGQDYFCKISEVGENFVQADILETGAATTELPGKIYLFQGIPKGDRMEHVIEKAVELGVYEIIPVRMRYCVVKLDDKKQQAKLKKWQALAMAAAKQSKRSLVPNIHPVMSYKEAIAYAFQSEACLIPYENENGMEGTKAALKKIRGKESVSILIGPEGGFAPEEIEAVKSRGEVISLGKRILRTDTAAITAMSMVMMEMEMQ
ncbi:16S rRNA (uracil(1498)-N(3))-methyltransferase [Roseburia sp. 1XD42-69]|uniref:16S rRNA (uracil(1498)-N(3))-methyltransferase n=1 Tax=Roseburia sp. 1XD42-69 TaxID=2320088 RepID=UPI000EA05379|nr:16S rRNA (uracil(1498)-N(3))-methyltransferase [Roseburia sp. 1XD42-69]RKJ65729.1 16S rRNA (uracil(1498)-N(3))-methyltransferase [Roseburia sp. 1XD42-69]